MKYKGITYRVIRDTYNRNIVRYVVVFFADRQWEFNTIKSARCFISTITDK